MITVLLHGQTDDALRHLIDSDQYRQFVRYANAANCRVDVVDSGRPVTKTEGTDHVE